MRPVVLATLALAIVSSTSHAQDHPSFAGRWVAEPPPAPARGEQQPTGARRPPELGSGWGNDLTITQDASRLMVEYAFFTRGDMQPPLRFVYALNGAPTSNTVMMGRGIQKQSAIAAWDGSTLVITSVQTFPGVSGSQPITSEMKQALSLDTPTTLRIETTRSGVLGGPSSTTRTTYAKR